MISFLAYKKYSLTVKVLDKRRCISRFYRLHDSRKTPDAGRLQSVKCGNLLRSPMSSSDFSQFEIMMMKALELKRGPLVCIDMNLHQNILNTIIQINVSSASAAV